MDKAEFWAQKPPLAEYHAITFDHPELDDPIRLVANQFDEVTLGGNVHTPVAMRLQPPENRGDGMPSMPIAFARQQVGRQVKAALRTITAAGSREPITVDYEVYLGDTDTPEISWHLYVADAAGVTFSPDNVQFKATLDNPMRTLAARIYDPAEFTGLEGM
jgi:hypothetical protein